MSEVKREGIGSGRLWVIGRRDERRTSIVCKYTRRSMPVIGVRYGNEKENENGGLERSQRNIFGNLKHTGVLALISALRLDH